MIKKSFNILIFLLIFLLYFVSFLMIYDTFKQRKLEKMEANALDVFDKQVKVKKKPSEEIDESSGNISILNDFFIIIYTYPTIKYYHNSYIISI